MSNEHQEVELLRAIVRALPKCREHGGRPEERPLATHEADDGDNYCKACVEHHDMQHNARWLDWGKQAQALNDFRAGRAGVPK